MLSEKLVHEMNQQIKYEFFSGCLYLAMAAYCEAEDLPGFAHFFRIQEQEERDHALKFFTYVNDVDGRVKMFGFDDPQNDYDSMLAVFQKAYAHEQWVTKRIYTLMDIAMEEKEHATISFLKWFVDEQIEEESTMKNIVKRLERIGNDAQALYALDAELATRVYTSPTV